MGYFFRRSANIGPFRLNFSKSGVGASVGIKGARLTMTPRGTAYITVGTHGFYYREPILNRGSKPPQTPYQPSVALDVGVLSDAIPTADVSDLVDSSRESLINGLNRRANMFNPAWIVFTIAVATFLAALVMFSSAKDLPDSASNRTDQYSTFIARYGEPNYLFITQPLGIVTVRTAQYSSARTKVVFVPTGCSDSYEEAMRGLERHSKLTKREIRGMMKCVPLSNAGWTLVGYIDPSQRVPIPVDVAKSRLDNITVKLTSLPAVEIEDTPVKQQKQTPRRLAEKQAPQLKAETVQQALAAEEKMKRDADAAESRALYARYAVLFGSFGLFVVGGVVHKKNTEKRTSRLFYELDEAAQQKFTIVQQALGQLSKSHRIWRIEGESVTSDWKRHAGASSLVRRAPISIAWTYPARVQVNLAISCINLNDVKLYFLPDVILYWERGIFGAISYDDFQVKQGFTTFIEREHAQADATLIDRTWRYVNKSGGPDRRFNNNVQLPVMRYGVLVLSSSRGLNIHLNTSNAQVSSNFASCWCELRSRGGQYEPPSEAHTRHDMPSGPEEQALKLLGLDVTASPSEVSAAYRRLAQMYHPDKVVGLATEFHALADKRMKEINAAYELLKGRANPAQPT